METALLPKAVALSGMNDPEGRTVQVPKDEAFKQIGAIKQEVQDYFRGVWPAEAKPLLGTLDALQSYTMDQRVDALRTRLSQSGRPINTLISMGIGWIRTINPLAVINSLHTLDQEIARTGSTKPFEQALQAIGLQFLNKVERLLKPGGFFIFDMFGPQHPFSNRADIFSLDEQAIRNKLPPNLNIVEIKSDGALTTVVAFKP